MWIWLVLAVLAVALTIERLIALLGSASIFPGISVVGILEVLAPAEAAMLFFVRWWGLRSGRQRRWRWLFVAAFFSFLTLLITGAATLASRPGGLTPAGIVIVLVGAAITIFAWSRSGNEAVRPGESSSHVG